MGRTRPASPLPGHGHWTALVAGRLTYRVPLRSRRQFRDLHDERERVVADEADEQPGRRPLRVVAPNGQRFVFQTTRDGPEGNTEIYVMNVNGTGVARLTNNTVIDNYPQWSTDGNRIVPLES